MEYFAVGKQHMLDVVGVVIVTMMVFLIP